MQRSRHRSPNGLNGPTEPSAQRLVSHHLSSNKGGLLLPMMLVISIVMGIVPLLGIAWTIATGTITTVDGLFMSLILLTLSAVFFLNAYWELRDRGALAFLDKKKVAAAATPKVTTQVATKETPKATAPAAPANVAVPANAAPSNTALANKAPAPEE